MYSSRRIERACHEDVAFRVITGNTQPFFTTINEFRRVHREHFGALFVDVLNLCRRAGLHHAPVPVLFAVFETSLGARTWSHSLPKSHAKSRAKVGTTAVFPTSPSMKPALYITLAGRNPTNLVENRIELRKSGYRLERQLPSGIRTR